MVRRRQPEVASVDVPQADNLALIRTLVAAVVQVGTDRKELAKATAFSGRHVRYRLEGARILGLLGEDDEVTDRGYKLLSAAQGSTTERLILRNAIARAPVVRAIVPGLLGPGEFDTAKVAHALSAATGLAPATAERRARVLRSWRRQVT